MSSIDIELPPKLIPVFSKPDVRYRGAYGGRGSGKTRSFALMSAVRGYMWAEANESGMILCGREFMNSLSDSSMEEIKQAIKSVPFLDNYYDIGESYIRTKCRRVEYSFAGLRHSLDSIKSKARVLLAWVDEAEGVSENAWIKLLPTVREDNSEVWISWNPEDEESSTNQRFRLADLGEDAIIVELNYPDNPWFPKSLDTERRNDQERMDGATYAWVWEGAYRKNSDAQIFKGKFKVEEFEPDPKTWTTYCGLDFGFSNDPTAAVKCHIFDDNLYIEYDAGRTNLELNETVKYLSDHIPDFTDMVVTADNARPESISYLKKHGMARIVACKKGKGSVEDGITFMKSFKKIIIHPRCESTIREFQRYSFKVTSNGDITNDIVDKDNHWIDAIRYALEDLMKKKGNFWGRRKTVRANPSRARR